MIYRNILIPTDGTLISEDILEFICAIQALTKSKIHVVYVIEVPRNLPLESKLPERSGSAKNAINKALAIAIKHGAQIDSSIVYARSAEDAILDTAADLKCDVIALAQDNHRLSIFANTASNIYQRAKCSVWLFNNKA